MTSGSCSVGALPTAENLKTNGCQTRRAAKSKQRARLEK
jgi:hypothetical protein